MDKTTGKGSGVSLKHCQICERDIKEVFIMGRVDGEQKRDTVIAHHGYQRPGDGYQTPSCMGAKYRAYEVACDALPIAIHAEKAWIAQREAFLKDFLANPPATIKEHYVSFRHEPKVFDRPEGFVGGKEFAEAGNYSGVHSYEYEYISTYKSTGYTINNAKRDVARMEKRLAVWVAPTK